MAAYFFCVKHHRVEEPDGDMCPVIDRLGPYPSREQAERALDKAAERNAEWDAEDARWKGDKPDGIPGTPGA